ncbi:hypothetical protein [Rhizobium rhizosphaerae]|uniref:hypothetical protein n=1 Tax=Xaviernesmea rhizosphaerae TaxID=1672749 RepID=UPI00111B016F|nr:hypothetical protein [Xaviernesmea rhizosphaerae]
MARGELEIVSSRCLAKGQQVSREAQDHPAAALKPLGAPPSAFNNLIQALSRPIQPAAASH